MSTVKLVEENSAQPIVKRVFADIKATKKIAFVPNIWRALATHPEHLELCWTRFMMPSRKSSRCWNDLCDEPEEDISAHRTLAKIRAAIAKATTIAA